MKTIQVKDLQPGMIYLKGEYEGFVERPVESCDRLGINYLIQFHNPANHKSYKLCWPGHYEVNVK